MGHGLLVGFFRQELIFGPENVTAGCTSDLRQVTMMESWVKKMDHISISPWLVGLYRDYIRSFQIYNGDLTTWICFSW